MSGSLIVNKCTDMSPFEFHTRVKASGLPNFMGVRIPVKSQSGGMERKFKPLLGPVVVIINRIWLSPGL